MDRKSELLALLAPYGVYDEKDLLKAMQGMKKLNIGAMVAPVAGKIREAS